MPFCTYRLWVYLFLSLDMRMEEPLWATWTSKSFLNSQPLLWRNFSCSLILRLLLRVRTLASCSIRCKANAFICSSNGFINVLFYLNFLIQLKTLGKCFPNYSFTPYISSSLAWAANVRLFFCLSIANLTFKHLSLNQNLYLIITWIEIFHDYKCWRIVKTIRYVSFFWWGGAD